MELQRVAVFKQWPIYFIGRILPAGVAFFGIALYTRFLDPGSVGVYALLLSMSFLVGTISFAWLRVATLRMSGTIDPGEEPDYAATILASFAAMSVLTAIVIVALVRITQPLIPWPAAWLTAGTAIASGWFELNVTACQSRLKLASYSALQCARAVATIVVTLLLIRSGFRTDALLGGYVVGNLFGFGAMGTWRPALGGRVSSTMLKRLWHFGWPSSAASLSYLSTTIQTFLVQNAVGNAALGIYAVAANFATQPIALLMGTASLAGQPLAFRARDQGTPAQLTAQLADNARLVFSIGLGATAGLIALANPLVNVYLGPSFRANGAVLIVISTLAIFLAGMRSWYFEQAFEISLHTRPVAYLQAIRVVVSIAFGVVLIHFYGVIGAAVGLLTTEALMLGVTIVWSRRHLVMPIPLVSFAKVVGASAAMVAVMQLVPDRNHVVGLVATVIVGTVVYGLSFGLLYRRTITALVRVRWPALLGTARS